MSSSICVWKVMLACLPPGCSVHGGVWCGDAGQDQTRRPLHTPHFFYSQSQLMAKFSKDLRISLKLNPGSLISLMSDLLVPVCVPKTEQCEPDLQWTHWHIFSHTNTGRKQCIILLNYATKATMTIWLYIYIYMRGLGSAQKSEKFVNFMPLLHIK